MNRFANLLSPVSPEAGGVKSTAAKQHHHYQFSSHPRAPPGTCLSQNRKQEAEAGSQSTVFVTGFQSVRSWQEEPPLEAASPQSYYKVNVHAGVGSRSMGNQDGGAHSMGAASHSNQSIRQSQLQQKLASSAKQTLAQLMGGMPRSHEKMTHQKKANGAQEAFAEEILDEGDMLQSHGVSPPRQSLLSNNLQNQVAYSKAICSVFTSSRQSRQAASETLSQALSPHEQVSVRDFTSPVQQDHAMESYKTTMTEVQKQQKPHQQRQSEHRQQVRPQQLKLQGCGRTMKRTTEQAMGIVCPESDSPINEGSAAESRTQGFSGDLLNIDSPRSNGSGGNGLSNRMACLTSKQKQFIQRVSFDRKLQDVFAVRAIQNTEEVSDGFDSAQVSIPPSAHTMTESSPGATSARVTGEFEPKGSAGPAKEEALAVYPQEASAEEKAGGALPSVTVPVATGENRGGSATRISELSSFAEQKNMMIAQSLRKKLVVRPSLDQVLGMSASTLIDYMHEVKMAKQRTQSSHEEQLQQFINTATVHQLNRLHTANESYMNSKRSETSHEVWNAHSSHQNGIHSPGSMQSGKKLRSGLYSLAAVSPRPEDESAATPHVRNESNLFNAIKASLVESYREREKSGIQQLNSQQSGKERSVQNLPASMSLSQMHVTIGEVVEESQAQENTEQCSPDFTLGPRKDSERAPEQPEGEAGEFKLKLVNINVKALESQDASAVLSQQASQVSITEYRSIDLSKTTLQSYNSSAPFQNKRSITNPQIKLPLSPEIRLAARQDRNQRLSQKNQKRGLQKTLKIDVSKIDSKSQSRNLHNTLAHSTGSRLLTMKNDETSAQSFRSSFSRQPKQQKKVANANKLPISRAQANGSKNTPSAKSQSVSLMGAWRNNSSAGKLPKQPAMLSQLIREGKEIRKAPGSKKQLNFQLVANGYSTQPAPSKKSKTKGRQKQGSILMSTSIQKLGKIPRSSIGVSPANMNKSQKKCSTVKKQKETLSQILNTTGLKRPAPLTSPLKHEDQTHSALDASSKTTAPMAVAKASETSTDQVLSDMNQSKTNTQTVSMFDEHTKSIIRKASTSDFAESQMAMNGAQDSSSILQIHASAAKERSAFSGTALQTEGQFHVLRQESFWRGECTDVAAQQAQNAVFINISPEKDYQQLEETPPEHQRWHDSHIFERSPNFGTQEESSSLIQYGTLQAQGPQECKDSRRYDQIFMSTGTLNENNDDTELRKQEPLLKCGHSEECLTSYYSGGKNKQNATGGANFCSLQGSREEINKILNNRDAQEDAQKPQSSFSTRYGGAETQRNTAAAQYYAKDTQLEQSVISRVSQQQQMPEFAQIYQTDGVENFINGFEQFTKQIENYIESKDEQMQNLIYTRRPTLKASLQTIEDSHHFRTGGSQSRPIRSGIRSPFEQKQTGGPESPRQQLSMRDKIASLEYLAPVLALANVGQAAPSGQAGIFNNKPVQQLRQSSTVSKVPGLQTNSDHTILSADGARVSFVTAKQTEQEIAEFEQMKGLEMAANQACFERANRKSLERLTPVVDTFDILSAGKVAMCTARQQASLSLCAETVEQLQEDEHKESDLNQLELDK